MEPNITGTPVVEDGNWDDERYVQDSDFEVQGKEEQERCWLERTSTEFIDKDPK